MGRPGAGGAADAVAEVLAMLQAAAPALREMGALREAVAAAMGRLEAADPAGEAVLTADLGELEVAPGAVELGAKLGEGAFGTVYRGKLHGLDVAVKTLRPLNLLGADVLVELRREVRMLLNLRHPNVLQLLAASTLDESKLFIVTEFLDQGDAYSAMQNPAISDGTTVDFWRQCALGCTYLHCR